MNVPSVLNNLAPPANRTGGRQPEHPPHSKRQRLSTACNQCRKRKVRCDEGQPSCRNCTMRGELCVTLDPNEPNKAITRRRANDLSERGGASIQVGRSQEPLISHGSVPLSISRNAHSIESAISSPISSSVTPSGMARESNENTADTERLDNAERRVSSDYSYDRATILNTDQASRKRKLLGNGTLQALARYLDRHFERKGWEMVDSRFAFGMQYAEEGPLTGLVLGQALPQLPSFSDIELMLSVFELRIYPIYPVLDMGRFRISLRQMSLHEIQRLPHGDIPAMSCLYSILALVADEDAGKYTAEGYAYLAAAYGLSAPVISLPYLPSVQATLLLTLALRARNKDGAAWQTLGHAIRIAQSIGLHRRVDSGFVHTPEDHRHDDDEEQLGSSVWWTCYCLEKTMGLEVGRPVSIRDADCNQIKPRNKLGHNFFLQWIGLAEIQSRLIDILYLRSKDRRNASDLLQDIGRTDRELCDWAGSVEPEEIRPTSDLLCAEEELHFATFLSMHYYQTIITVHQAALMVDTKTYQSKIAHYCQDSPFRGRLRSSESILLNAARKIAHLQIDLADRQINSKLITVTPIMLAMMVLVLNVTRSSDSSRTRLDAELMMAISLHAEYEYTSAGQSQEFIEAIRILRGHVQKQVQATPHPKFALQRNFMTAPTSLIPSGSFDQTQSVGHSEEHNGSVSAYGDSSVNLSVPADQSMNFSEYIQLDQPWNWLLSDDAGMPIAEYSFME